MGIQSHLSDLKYFPKEEKIKVELRIYKYKYKKNPRVELSKKNEKALSVV